MARQFLVAEDSRVENGCRAGEQLVLSHPVRPAGQGCPYLTAHQEEATLRVTKPQDTKAEATA